ncbi:DNA polymerase III subunit chi [Prosthecomicrobium sp. N25]|uniref:DNA polymerase III subunit chi n=1 Tax=Prosthecomicrobium sp. N25 TaxID=3129254 RepID=UPI0030782E8C
MAEAWFYHLVGKRLEDVLPGLIERSLERGWRVVVQAGSEERRDALDAHLWTYAEESFLPHGTRRDGDPSRQPVYLTAEGDNPNGAAVRFLVDRAEPPDLAVYERAVYIFDGGDPEALQDARRRWRDAKAAGLDVTYWQQDDRGRWVKKA